jgi:hypothetical protein
MRPPGPPAASRAVITCIASICERPWCGDADRTTGFDPNFGRAPVAEQAIQVEIRLGGYGEKVAAGVVEVDLAEPHRSDSVEAGKGIEDLRYYR